MVQKWSRLEQIQPLSQLWTTEAERSVCLDVVINLNTKRNIQEEAAKVKCSERKSGAEPGGSNNSGELVFGHSAKTFISTQRRNTVGRLPRSACSRRWLGWVWCFPGCSLRCGGGAAPPSWPGPPGWPAYSGTQSAAPSPPTGNRKSHIDKRSTLQTVTGAKSHVEHLFNQFESCLS